MSDLVNRKDFAVALCRDAGAVAVEVQDAGRMIREGGRVIVGAPDVFEALTAIAEDAWAG